MEVADKGCGCIPTAPPSKPSPDTTAPASAPATASAPGVTGPASSDQPRRHLKLVVTLEPSGERHYHAIVAVGSPHCDPLFRAFDSSDVSTVLDAIPTLVSEAETAWNMNPRYPTAKPPSTPKSVEKARAPIDGSGAAPSPESSSPRSKSEDPASAAKQSSGQLSLFG